MQHQLRAIAHTEEFGGKHTGKFLYWDIYHLVCPVMFFTDTSILHFGKACLTPALMCRPKEVPPGVVRVRVPDASTARGRPTSPGRRTSQVQAGGAPPLYLWNWSKRRRSHAGET